MNDIFKQLSDIESVSSSILEQANNRKKELSAAMDQKIADFDQETAKDTAAAIAAQKETLNAQIAKELQTQQAATQNALDKLEHEYEQNHTALAEQILLSMIKE